MVNLTNIESRQLNYVRYSQDRYDRDIVNSVPYHQAIHSLIEEFIKRNLDIERPYDVLDLGVGTGLTARCFQALLPKSHLDLVDFSHHMLHLARKRLGKTGVRYLYGDYSKLRFTKQYDIIESVIGIHHQKYIGKRKLFQKIYKLLKSGGYFVFGDLVTYRDPHVSAINNARHYHHLVQHAHDDRALRDWSYHHMFLNELAPVEDQIDWLKEAGFEVKKEFLKINTALLICHKPE